VNLALLQSVKAAVDLIQKQSTPFAYVPGATHTGLSGDGEISVSGLLGMQAEVTTLPDSVGREDGSPIKLFDVGYITFGSGDGWEDSRRLDKSLRLVFPPYGGLYTKIGYSLRPGVVISITELEREPAE